MSKTTFEKIGIPYEERDGIFYPVIVAGTEKADIDAGKTPMEIQENSCWQGVFICFTKKNLYGLSLKGYGPRIYLKNIPI